MVFPIAEDTKLKQMALTSSTPAAYSSLLALAAAATSPAVGPDSVAPSSASSIPPHPLPDAEPAESSSAAPPSPPLSPTNLPPPVSASSQSASVGAPPSAPAPLTTQSVPASPVLKATSYMGASSPMHASSTISSLDLSQSVGPASHRAGRTSRLTAHTQQLHRSQLSTIPSNSATPQSLSPAVSQASSVSSSKPIPRSHSVGAMPRKSSLKSSGEPLRPWLPASYTQYPSQNIHAKQALLAMSTASTTTTVASSSRSSSSAAAPTHHVDAVSSSSAAASAAATPTHQQQQAQLQQQHPADSVSSTQSQIDLISSLTNSYLNASAAAPLPEGESPELRLSRLQVALNDLACCFLFFRVVV